MTDAPSPADAPDPPAEAARKKRTRLQALAFFGGMAAAILAALLIMVAVGGRMYLLSDSGRGLVTSFVAGKKLGRYGRINVEGVRGDLFDDFTIDRVTVTDARGVWLEARKVRVNWDWWPLVGRRFHATEVEAEVIRLIRRPELDPSTEPPGPQPLSIKIDRFAADVELLEGFSREYGRWRLTGEADVPRKGAKQAILNATSNSRPGDYLRLRASVGDAIGDLRLNLRANEAQGGPLAGALGYSPNQPFFATAVVNGEVIDAVVRTGDFVPLVIKGRYGETLTRISGFIDFSGSDLLAPFAERIGRTARFGFATSSDSNGDGRIGVGWRLMAENLDSRASGEIRLSDQSSPDGVTLDVSTRSLTRLIGHGAAGPAAYKGVFRGDASFWTLRGSVDLIDADLSSYRAQRIRGPLNLQMRQGRLDIDGDIRAAGGSSAGIVGGLLGATPHLSFEAARQADGALLLRRIDLTGQAVTVTGSGGRDLLGALGFRGRAEITDASRLRSGAKGVFGGPVTASMVRTGAPWRLTYDGRGRGLAVGMDELDRLLGPTPRLQLTGALNGGRIEVERAQLTAANGSAGARGLIEGDGRLRLALDWSANGPFGVGPVAIDGAMTGEGALTGTLAEPRADLTAAFGQISAGALTLTDAEMVLSFRRGADASNGRIAVTSGSNYGPARASGNFFLGGDHIRLTEVDLNAGGVTAQGAVALSNNVPSSADLTFTARPGAFLASGRADGRIRLTDGAGAEAAILNVSGRDVRFPGSSWIIRTLDLNGRGTLERLPFTLTVAVGGATPVSFDGSGIYSRDGPAQSVVLEGSGRVREIAFTTRNPAVIALAGDGRVARVDLSVGGGVLLGELRQDSRAAIIETNLTSVDLGALVQDMRGRVTGRLSLRGAGDDLSGSANITLAGIRSIDAPRGIAVDGTLNALLVNNTLRIQANAADGDAVRAVADITLPVEASAAPLRLAIARTRDMSGEVSIQGQVQPIWDLLAGGERSLSGQVDARATLAGSLAEPRLNGRLDLRQGSFRDSATGVRLENVALASRFDDTTGVVETFSAVDGSGGSVTGNGRIGLKQGSGSSFQLLLNRFRIIDNDVAEAKASGPLTVTRGADGNITLSGQMDIDEARIEANPPGSTGIVRMDVIEINKPGGDVPEAEQNLQRGLQFGLDIALRSPGGDVRVIGRGLNVEMNVDARVTGTIARPVLSGTARVVRGDYDFAGKRFVFDDRGTVSLSTNPELIRLNLTATREDPALTATIRVTGTAARPQIVLTSTPALPQDEILSQVLFGRSASQLSAFEAAQLASGVAALAGGGGFDVIGNLRELAGLDRLSFGGEASGLTVAGGRYISDDVYLEIIGGGENGAAVNVEWQVRRNLTVSSKFGGQGEASLSIRWRRQSRQPGTGREDRRPNR
ncbi:MAG: translocation/assembly module TamB domain-containing protein [Brevundimonas sp.]|uniref:translocation/assembly module TamB domain-containing protein n=1 Tax=Brevundimonas sp. TaxID=1871086 RepID=UPI002733329C|nr:translocation/assembly module TamB domain-containing protein [Brevundimonas sp.]MDP3657290.1 translocation/assembly module TamB domain-containing protein [Brevundimonas sp.]MDZ4060593.1 translocation/assembly module TamB domain-containing protein [Brevundimonas sp.]